MQDTEIINGLHVGNMQRAHFEKVFYLQYRYFIEEGARKYNLAADDSFSAYSDAVLSAIQNIRNNNFNNQASLKTYLFQIFCNKCIDLARKKTTNRAKVHQAAGDPELLTHLPDATKTIIEKLIDRQRIMAIKQYLDVIGKKCKDVLLLFEDGYSDNEIAEKLAYNTAAVAKTTRLRCLEKIKEKIKSASLKYE